MFRRERPQKGRYRQFYQIGAEVIGSESPAVDAEVIEMVVDILRTAGLQGFTTLLNSVGCPVCRPKFIAQLREKLRDVAPSMCEDCRRRSETNALRVLDCKVPQDQPIIDSLPSILDHLCQDCRTHFDAVRRYLNERGIVYEVRPRLVRGLDYYRRTTFEMVHGALGAQSAILGGGRYDGLAETLGSKVHAPGIGFSIGEDRFVMSVEAETGTEALSQLDWFIAVLTDAALPAAARLAGQIRRGTISSDRVEGRVPHVEVAQGKLKRLLELANKSRARNVVMIGEDEMRSGQYMVKDMETGNQSLRTEEEILRDI
jgi:histidyl-tRNA synthetase